MRILRYCSILPALIMLFFIFCFSAQDGEESGSLSYHISCEVVHKTASVLSLDYTEEEILNTANSIHLLIRKAAHVSEYFLLTMLLYLPMRVLILTKCSTKKRLLLCFVLAVIFAALDEFHQTFVAGRSGNPTDVLIDSLGVAAAILILLLLHLFHRRKTISNQVQ